MVITAYVNSRTDLRTTANGWEYRCHLRGRRSDSARPSARLGRGEGLSMTSELRTQPPTSAALRLTPALASPKLDSCPPEGCSDLYAYSAMACGVPDFSPPDSLLDESGGP